FQNLGIAHAVEIFFAAFATVVDFIQQFAQLGDFLLFTQHPLNLFAQTFGGQTQVDFHDLTDAHPRRYTQRVQYDIHRYAVFVVRHIFDRFNRGDNTFVTVTTSHLVTRLDLPFDRQIHLNDFQHARRQVIALLQLALLVFELVVQLLTTLIQRLLSQLQGFG